MSHWSLSLSAVILAGLLCAGCSNPFHSKRNDFLKNAPEETGTDERGASDAIDINPNNPDGITGGEDQQP